LAGTRYTGKDQLGVQLVRQDLDGRGGRAESCYS
jgi:hypothetical protein